MTYFASLGEIVVCLGSDAHEVISRGSDQSQSVLFSVTPFAHYVPLQSVVDIALPSRPVPVL